MGWLPATLESGPEFWQKERGREIQLRETKGEIQATEGGVLGEREREREGGGREIQATGLEFQQRERDPPYKVFRSFSFSFFFFFAKKNKNLLRALPK